MKPDHHNNNNNNNKPHPHAGNGNGHGLPYLPPPRRNPAGGRTNLASCVVATLFLIFLVIVVLILYFSLLQPKAPLIAVNAVEIPSFTAANGTVSFTFSQYISVKNPNRATFAHFDSSLELLHGGDQAGFMYIPAGEIAAGQTEYMAATFAVKSVSIGATPVPERIPAVGDGIERVSPAMEMELRVEVAGRVRILHFFTHRVTATADCMVAIAVNDGSVLGFHC